MKCKRLHIDIEPIFIVLFIITFTLSGFYYIQNNKERAEEIALIAFSLLLIGWLYELIFYIFKFIKSVFNIIIGLSAAKVYLMVFFIYSLFLFLHIGQPNILSISLPRVYGGDEEHYLIMINSLIKDFDLELKNNYKSVREGGYDAGFAWRNRILDHHSVFVHKKTKDRIVFNHVVNVGPYVNKWDIINPDVYNDLDSYLERPHHPPGMAFIFALMLFPFAGWEYIESAAILIMVMISIIGLVHLHKILKSISISDRREINITLFLISFATPFFYYSLILFKEVFLASIIILICWFYFFKKQGFLSGILFIIGCFTRYSFPVIAIPLILYGLFKRQWKQLLIFVLTCSLGLFAILLYNHYMYGGVFRFSQMWDFGRWLTPKYILYVFVIIPLALLILILAIKFISRRQFIKDYFNLIRIAILTVGVVMLFFAYTHYPAVKGIFIDLKNGILPFSPVLIFPFFMMLDIKIWKDDKIAGILGVLLIYFVIYVVRGLGVGSAFACRQIVPVMPLMGIPLYYWMRTYKNKFMVILFNILAVYSICINMLAVYAKLYFWHLPLDAAFIKLFHDIFIIKY